MDQCASLTIIIPDTLLCGSVSVPPDVDFLIIGMII